MGRVHGPRTASAGRLAAQQRSGTGPTPLDRGDADGRSTGRAVGDNKVLLVSSLIARGHDPVGECRVERRAAYRTPWRRPLSGPGALVVGRRFQRCPHSRRVDGQAPKDLPRRPLDIEKAEQDVFGLDMVVVAAEREPRRPLQSSFGSVGEGKLAGIAVPLSGDGLGDLLSGPVERRPGGHQRPRCAVLAIGHDPEQKVLGPDVAVTEPPGLLLRKSDDPTGTVAEPIEHERDRTAYARHAAGQGPSLVKEPQKRRRRRRVGYVASTTVAPAAPGIIRPTGAGGGELGDRPNGVLEGPSL